MDNIKQFPAEKTFPKEGELTERIIDLIDEYSGDISLVATIGILDLVKQTKINNAIDD